jgi:uncharacterized membrane protein
VEERHHRRTPPKGVVAVREDTDLDRLIGLSDGVFAFALTLLVLSLVVPALSFSASGTEQSESVTLGLALRADWTTFLAYVFAFVMIATWWTNHNRVFRYIYRYDDVLVWLNFAVLLEVSVMPFILGVFARYSDLAPGIALFAGVQAATGLTLNAIWRYASGGDRLIHPDYDPVVARKVADWGTLPALIFALSIPLAFVSIYAAYAAWVVVFPSRRFVRHYGG